MTQPTIIIAFKERSGEATRLLHSLVVELGAMGKSAAVLELVLQAIDTYSQYLHMHSNSATESIKSSYSQVDQSIGRFTRLKASRGKQEQEGCRRRDSRPRPDSNTSDTGRQLAKMEKGKGKDKDKEEDPKQTKLDL